MPAYEATERLFKMDNIRHTASELEAFKQMKLLYRTECIKNGYSGFKHRKQDL